MIVALAILYIYYRLAAAAMEASPPEDRLFDGIGLGLILCFVGIVAVFAAAAS